MPEDLPDNNSISGGNTDAVAVENERPQSLREIAEAAYDEASKDPSEGRSSEEGPVRDERGRFAAKDQAAETGEAEREAPSPEKPPVEAKQAQPDPAAPQGVSNQPPEHWSADDRATFDRLPQDAKAFFMRRYTEMEADYTRKSQANANAVNAINALTPVFQDPDISRSMQEMQLNPIQAIHDWARLHKGAVSGNPRDRASILIEIAERMGFDPAKVFVSNRQLDQNVPEEVRNSPMYRYLTDTTGRTTSELQALRAELQQFKQAETHKAQEEAVRVSRSSIDHFADEKGADGKPVRPYFDRVIDKIILMYRENPERDLQEVYETACWMDKDVRSDMMRAEMSKNQHQQSNARAAQAARSNVRGLTSPVSKPPAQKTGNGSLRDALESSADEVGF